MDADKKRHDKFDGIFYKSHKQFLVAGLLFSIAGIASDSTYYFLNDKTALLYMNLISAGLLLFAVIDFFLKKINKKTTAIILIYTMVINILITNVYFFEQNSADWQFYILRGTIIILIFISITALLLNRTHIIVINILYSGVIFLIRYFSKEPGFITQESFLLVLIVVGFSYALYMFNHQLKISLQEKNGWIVWFLNMKKRYWRRKKTKAENF